MDTAPTPADRETPRLIEEEMKSAYLDYAMSVIVGRALPDVRDGLKPVHRRILFAMGEMGLLSSKPHKKSARVVGEVLGKFHPHGDLAIYDSLVRMAQPFSLRYPLVDGQGNFGSIDGDNAAAMRYTEARLHRIAEEMLQDLDQETVAFQANFDGSLQEPMVLPPKIPNLLVNGSTGIAVGMTTNIPPFNLGEVIDATVLLLDNPGASGEEIMRVMPGPDFPTGGIILSGAELQKLHSHGRGYLMVRGRVEQEKNADQRDVLVITEIPFQLAKSALIEEIAKLVKDKRIEGVTDLRDESSREGLRVVMELRKGEDPEVVKNLLFKHSRLQSTFAANMVVLVENRPRCLGVVQLILEFLKHRREVVTRRTQFQLAKAQERSHIIEGLIAALDRLDDTIQTIRASKGREDALGALKALLSLSDAQAKAILELRLQALTSLEQDTVRDEQKEILERIADYLDVLARPERVTSIIREELVELKGRYGDARRTEILADEGASLEMEDLIKEEPMAITISSVGYAKRMPLDLYQTQRRGGKGIIAATTREGDFVKHLFVASTHSHLLCFTSSGKVDWLKVFQIPEGGRQGKGKLLVNLLSLDENERVTAVLAVREFKEASIFFVTRRGHVKKTSLESYSNPRKGGIIAIGLDEGDAVVDVLLTDGSSDILLATRKGMAIRFSGTEVREVGRSAQGVRGISLQEGDEVVAAVTPADDRELLTITENGFGKRTPLSDFHPQGRGGQGVISIKTAGRNGGVVDVKIVGPEEELMLISQQGVMIRMAAKDIPSIGRNTMGVTLMRLSGEDRVMSVASVPEERSPQS